MSDDHRSFEDVQDEVTDNDIPDASDISIPSSVQADHLEIRGGDARLTQGTIDGYEFSLRVDGDAPDALVADIEARLAECKAERENDE